MIPAMAIGCIALFGIAWVYGKRERARLGVLQLPDDHQSHAEISVSQYPEARRPKLLWINGALTAALFIVGRWAIGLYLGQAALGTAPGRIG